MAHIVADKVPDRVVDLIGTVGVVRDKWKQPVTETHSVENLPSQTYQDQVSGGGTGGRCLGTGRQRGLRDRQ